MQSQYLDYIHFHDKPSCDTSSLSHMVLQEDISKYISKDKVKNYLDIAVSFPFDNKLSYIKDKYIFAQIVGYSNIAEPKNTAKDDDNLDVVEKTENKYLQGGEDTIRKSEKIIRKYQLYDGVCYFYGVELEPIAQCNSTLSSSKNIYMKVLVGPHVEVRRSIFYLNHNNFKLLG